MFVTGTVPMLLSDNVWGAALPFPRRVPWKQLLVPLSERYTEVGQMHEAVSSAQQAADAGQMAMAARMQTAVHLEGVHQMQQAMSSAKKAHIVALMARAAPDVLWHVPRSRVADNLIEDAERMVERYKDGLDHQANQWEAISTATTECYNHMKSSKQFGKPGPIGLLKVPQCSSFPAMLTKR